MDTAKSPLTRLAIALVALLPASAPSLAAGPPEPDSFRLVSSAPYCVFTVTNRYAHMSYDRGAGNTRAHVDLYCHDRNTARCQVRCFPIPAAAKKMTLIEAIKFGGLEAWTEKGTLEKMGNLQLHGIRGEEYAVKGLARDTTVRVFLAHGHAYILSVMPFADRKPDDVERDVQSFFESFQIAAP